MPTSKPPNQIDGLGNPNEEMPLTWAKRILVSVIIIWIITFVVGLVLGACGLAESLARFGDWFGTINALFSSLALAGAVYAVLLQREDLRLTREEYSLSRKAQQSSADSQERLVKIEALSSLLDDSSRESAAAAKEHQLFFTLGRDLEEMFIHLERSALTFREIPEHFPQFSETVRRTTHNISESLEDEPISHSSEIILEAVARRAVNENVKQTKLRKTIQEYRDELRKLLLI